MTEFEDLDEAQLLAAQYRARAKLLQIGGLEKRFADDNLYTLRSPLFYAYVAQEVGDKRLSQCVPTVKRSFNDDQIEKVSKETYNCLMKNKDRLSTLINYLRQAQKEKQNTLFPELSKITSESKNVINANDDTETFHDKLKQSTDQCKNYIQSGKITLPDFHYCLLASSLPDTYKSCGEKSGGEFADCVLSDQKYKVVEKRMPRDFAFFTRVLSSKPFE